MTAIWVAIVTAIGTIVVAAIQSLRRQNTREHAENTGRLDKIIHGLGRVEQKIDHHIDNHGGKP